MSDLDFGEIAAVRESAKRGKKGRVVCQIVSDEKPAGAQGAGYVTGPLFGDLSI
jgi:hypothetical protein